MSYSVWTYNDAPEWVARNGTREMVLAQISEWEGQPHDSKARFLCERLLQLMPDRVFEIRQGNQVVSTFSNRAPLQSSDTVRRRPLGKRES